MSRAEWQRTFQSWLAVGAAEQELWRRLSNARISDADPSTLEAQRRMESLSAEQGMLQIRKMLEANPAFLRDAGIEGLLFHLQNFLNPTNRAELGDSVHVTSPRSIL